MFSPEERNWLLARAYDAITSSVSHTGIDEIDSEADAMAAPMGAFVTLYVNGALRGCIGYVETTRSLTQTVRLAAEKAATEDYRFPPIREEELGLLAIQISVIGRMRPMNIPSDIRIGVDGIIIEYAGLRGLLLPQVAVEWKFGPIEFLEATCRKTGVHESSWRDESARVTLFETEIIGGKEPLRNTD